MTVKQLIKKLKKEDPDANVLWADHDHSYGEWNNHVRAVHEFDHEEVEGDEFKLNTEINYVVLRS